MKNIFYLLLCILCLPPVAFAQNNQLENFRQNIPLYTSSAALLLSQTKVDPVVPDIIAKVLPEAANENVDGAIQAVGNILYQRKGIKALDPSYTQYLDSKIRALIVCIKSKDYTNIIAAIADISIHTNDYVHQYFIRTTSSDNNHQSEATSSPKNYQSQGNSVADPINRDRKGPNGQTVYIGPKGGNYYYSQNGSKVYLRSGN